jgi:hypothetical protein
MTWFALKVLMAARIVLRGVSAGRGSAESFVPWARRLAALLCLKPVLDDLTHGNVNLFILALVVGCMVAYRARQDGAAGFVASIGNRMQGHARVTSFPISLTNELGVSFSARLPECFCSLPGFVPAARLGMDHNLKQLKSWYSVMVHPFVIEGKVTAEHINRSITRTGSPLVDTFSVVCDLQRRSRNSGPL